MRGTAAKLHLALTGAPDFRGADLRTRLVIAPSARAVEDAFNPVKYGRFSDAPVMEIVLPSAFEDGLAPAGHHVLSAIVQFAPSRPEGGWDAHRAAFLDTHPRDARSPRPRHRRARRRTPTSSPPPTSKRATA